MGWSLEAALVVPISTVLVVAGIILAEPLYDAGLNSGRLEVIALISSRQENDIYQICRLSVNDAACTGLIVSPGRVIQLARIVRDDLNALWRMLPEQK